MSWWVYLEDHTAESYCSFGKEPADDYERKWGACTSPCYPAVTVARFTDGGTYAIGGTDEAELNVTYNYGSLFREALGGGFQETISGKRAGEVLPLLVAGRDKLGTERDRDYWAATPGNAGIVLARLAAWAEEHPDAIFRVS